MRLAVLGTGKIVQEALPVLEGLGIRPHAILGTERSRERAEALAARYRIPRRCFRYEEVLESGADTIYVALPNSLHYVYARRALEGGLHVLVEKPAVTALAQLRELRRLAAGADSFTLPFTLSALADYISADRSAMMRELKRMKEEGLVEMDGRRVTLRTGEG